MENFLWRFRAVRNSYRHKGLRPLGGSRKKIAKTIIPRVETGDSVNIPFQK